MFRTLNFDSGWPNIYRGEMPPIAVRRLITALYYSTEAAAVDLSNEKMTAWAEYCIRLIPLRLPLYWVWDHPLLKMGDDSVAIIGGRDGVLEMQKNPRPDWRPARSDEVDAALLIVQALKAVADGDDQSFMQSPEPLPTHPNNCAAAYALLKIDEAISGEQNVHTLVEAMSVAALICADIAADVGRDEGRSSTAEAAASKRWEQDPTQTMKLSIYEEWQRWNGNRKGMPRPQDFRREMALRHPTLIDGTLKNWMSEWGRGGGP